MSDREKLDAYEVAEGILLLLVSYYSKIVYDEEQKAIPNTEQITQWENEKRAIMALKRALNVEDQINIANIEATYGPVVRALMSEQ